MSSVLAILYHLSLLMVTVINNKMKMSRETIVMLALSQSKSKESFILSVVDSHLAIA